MAWRDLKSLNRLRVGNGDLALRDVLEEWAHPCMPRQSIVLSQGPACRDQAWSPPHGDDPDRLRSFHDDLFALSISVPHPVAARLVVGPDDVRDVGVSNERYDAVTPSGSGIGSKIDGSHCKSSCRPRFSLRASAPGRPQKPLYAHSAPASDETVRPAQGRSALCQAAPLKRLGDFANLRRR